MFKPAKSVALMGLVGSNPSPGAIMSRRVLLLSIIFDSCIAFVRDIAWFAIVSYANVCTHQDIIQTIVILNRKLLALISMVAILPVSHRVDTLI